MTEQEPTPAELARVHLGGHLSPEFKAGPDPAPRMTEQEAEARRRNAWIADLREQGGANVQQLAELYEDALSKAEQELQESEGREALEKYRAIKAEQERDKTIGLLHAARYGHAQAERELERLREALDWISAFEVLEPKTQVERDLTACGELARRALQATQEDGA